MKLLEIFKIKSLNTTKYLNYIAFKEAFFLYYKRNPNLALTDKLKIFNTIREIKNSMNTQRNNFELPKDHQIKITPYWFLGFIEGDGSFSISSLKSFPLKFNITQVITEEKVLESIKTFLLELPGNYKKRSKKSNQVQILKKIKILNNKTKLLLTLAISDFNYIKTILTPFFDQMKFLSKKELDYIN
jgi:hypothetical protein